MKAQWWCLLVASAPTMALAQDSDRDGVPDVADVEPCDASVSRRLFVPAEGVFGMTWFEDQWPAMGDFDFNDVVVAHHAVVDLNDIDQVRRVRLDLEVVAKGAAFDNGLAYRIPGAPRGSVASARLSVAGAAALELQPWSDEADATFTLVENVGELLGGAPGQLVNTGGEGVTRPTVVLSFVVEFAPSQTLDTALAPFDLFVVQPERSVEIHRPEFAGTSRLDVALVPAWEGPGSNFVTRNGIPFALELPRVGPYMAEGHSIELGFPSVTVFGSSGGTQALDWYAQNTRPAYAYAASPTSASIAAPTYTADRSCMPAGAPCQALADQGVSTSGVYRVDPDGAGGVAPFDVYCEMDLAGGGWTLVANRRAGTANREACGNRLMDFFTNGCGSANAIGASDSYSMTAVQRQAAIADASEVMIVQYRDGRIDDDDAYIMEFATPGRDLFVNYNQVLDVPVARVCNLSGARCDSSNVWFKYAGDSWYHSSYCRASNWAGSTTYRGNYGLCHNGWDGQSSSHFTGDRAGYNETKLWGYGNLAGSAHQERIFYR